MQINFVLACVIAVVSMLVLPLVLTLTVKNNKAFKITTVGLLCVYLILLMIGVFATVDVKYGVAHIHLDISEEFLNKSINWTFARLRKRDVFLNLIMLIPMGIAYSFLTPKSFLKQLGGALIIGFLVGATIETIQYFIPIERGVQLSDAVFNMTSMAIGVIIAKLMLKISKRQL